MDPSPASDPAIVAGAFAIVGTAVTALAFALKTLAKRKSASVPPRAIAVEPARQPQSTGSSTSQMRAVTDAVLRQNQDDALRQQVSVMHEIVTARDVDGFPRVHNKTSIEKAILQSRDFDRDQLAESRRTNALLEELVREIRGGRPRMPSTTDAE